MITVTWGADHALAYQNSSSVRVLGARELGLPLDVAFAELGQGSLSAARFWRCATGRSESSTSTAQRCRR